MGKQLGVKYTGQSSGMIKKETHDDAAERAFHANKPANEAMARNFAAMVMSSAKPVGSVGMKLPSQIIKDQQTKGGSAPAVPKTDTHIAEQKAKEEAKVANEKAERDKKDKADKELKAKAEAPKAASTSSSASLTKVSSTGAADKAKKEKEEKEKKEKEEKEKKAKSEKEKAEKEKAEKEKKAKEQEEAKRKAIEASKRPASFGIDRSKSPGKPAATVLPVAPVKEEVRAKSVSKDERPGSRPKSPEKVEIHKEEKHLEVVHEVAVSSGGGSGHTKLEKDRWYVEGYDGATHSDPIIVKVDSPKESVYIGKCTNGVVVQVEGKCKSLQVNSSHDVGLVCETVVATVEIMNSSKCQIQTTGIVNLIQLDNCDRCKLFLSKDALAADCKIFTAKSANTLVYTPTDDGEDMLEMSLPEQFISSMNEEGNAIRHEIVMPEALLS